MTNKDLEGETTALYIANLLKNSSCKVTKPAQGLPSGAIIEYADPLTMSEAIKGRVLVGKENEWWRKKKRMDYSFLLKA